MTPVPLTFDGQNLVSKQYVIGGQMNTSVHRLRTIHGQTRKFDVKLDELPYKTDDCLRVDDDVYIRACSPSMSNLASRASKYNL